MKVDVDVDVDVNEMPLFRGVHTLIFTYVPYIVISIHEEPANFSKFFALLLRLPKNKRKCIPKVLNVHLNLIQLYLNSASPGNQCKLKP